VCKERNSAVDTIDLSKEPSRWKPENAFLLLAVLWEVAMFSSHIRDPTVFNRLTPPEGIHNWLGLPGALLGGSLLEFVGPPAVLLVWFLIPLTRPKWHRFSLRVGWYYAIVLTWLLSILHVQLITLDGPTVPFRGLWTYGHVGVMGADWLLRHMEQWEAITLVGVAASYAALRIATALPFVPMLKVLLLLLIGGFTLLRGLPWARIPQLFSALGTKIGDWLFAAGLMRDREALPPEPSAEPFAEPLPESSLLLGDAPLPCELEPVENPNDLEEVAQLYEQWLQVQHAEPNPALPTYTRRPQGLRLGQVAPARSASRPFWSLGER
jgi:hypothetical protein